MPYALASHAFACADGDHIVLLDLREDRYFALEAARTAGLRSLVSGWPDVSADGEIGGSSEAGSAHVIQMLVGKGLLTAGAAGSRPPAMPAVAKATHEVFCDQYEDRPRHSTGTVLKFVAATAVGGVAVRCWSMRRIVGHVRKRNEAHRTAARPCDSERIRKLITAFADLRPFLFGWRDACFFESFVLIEFLARQRIFPTWVFGVQARPFAAHCWVQLGDAVLNDTVERTGAYTPIMTV